MNAQPTPVPDAPKLEDVPNVILLMAWEGGWRLVESDIKFDAGDRLSRYAEGVASAIEAELRKRGALTDADLEGDADYRHVGQGWTPPMIDAAERVMESAR